MTKEEKKTLSKLMKEAVTEEIDKALAEDIKEVAKGNPPIHLGVDLFPMDGRDINEIINKWKPLIDKIKDGKTSESATIIESKEKKIEK